MLRKRGYEIEEKGATTIFAILTEGVNDKHILKALFTAGGPGSGKTYISNQMVKGLGLKAVTSDEPLERYLKRANLSFIMDPSNPEQYAAQQVAREKAKEVTDRRQEIWEKGLLGLILDGTGKRSGEVVAWKRRLESLGYDTAMVFVDTPLQMALDANVKRGQEGGRTVDPEITKDIWQMAQKNIDVFSNAFGKNFFIIKREKTGRLEGEAERIYGQQLRRIGMKWLDKPLENPIGKAIIARLRDTGGKTRDDLPKNFTTSVPSIGESSLRRRSHVK